MHTTAMTLAPCGLYRAQGRGCQVFIWRGEIDSGPPVRIFRNGFSSPISVVNWSTDSRTIVAGSVSGEVLAWRVGQGTMLLANRLSWRHTSIREVIWSPSGLHLAALTATHTLQVWDIVARRCIALFGCSKWTTSLEWANDGSHIRTNHGEHWICPF